MSEQNAQPRTGGIEFDEGEAAILRDIVTGWIDEQFIYPPFPPELSSVIEKLDIATRIQVPDTTPAPTNLENIQASANQ